VQHVFDGIVRNPPAYKVPFELMKEGAAALLMAAVSRRSS